MLAFHSWHGTRLSDFLSFTHYFFLFLTLTLCLFDLNFFSSYCFSFSNFLPISHSVTHMTHYKSSRNICASIFQTNVYKIAPLSFHSLMSFPHDVFDVSGCHLQNLSIFYCIKKKKKTRFIYPIFKGNCHSAKCIVWNSMLHLDSRMKMLWRMIFLFLFSMLLFD